MLFHLRRRPHFERDYLAHVARLLRRHSYKEAMSLAVGGGFEEIGRAQVELLIEVGLKDGMSMVDLGCGSGRTAVQIAHRFPRVDYLGVDVVPALLAHARAICPTSFRFVRSTSLALPAPDNSAEMVVAFSIFTHLHHEESFAYLADCWRVLRSGGRVVFSFLEFAESSTWHIFEHTVATRKAGRLAHMNAFLERSVVSLWADKLNYRLERFVDTGQTTAIFVKRED